MKASIKNTNLPYRGEPTKAVYKKPVVGDVSKYLRVELPCQYNPRPAPITKPRKPVKKAVPPKPRKNMQKAVGILFFVSWLLCGCGVETMLDHPAVGAVTLSALIVVIACAMVLSGKEYDE